MAHFSIHLLRTMTGEVGFELEAVRLGEWTIKLNTVESFSFTITADELRAVPWNWRHPWMAGAALVFHPDDDEDGLGIPWIAGPFIERGKVDLETGLVEFQVRGIREIFKHRFVMKDDFGPGEEDDLKKSLFRFEGYSLGTVAELITKAALDRPAGALPIRFDPALYEYTGEPKFHIREYEGFNLSNNKLHERLLDLSNSKNGPDIMFQPRWKPGSNGKYIEWWMEHGTESNPCLRQSKMCIWDTTAPSSSSVTDVEHVVDTQVIANRVYATGDGEGVGTAIAVAQDLSMAGQGMPLLETTEAFSGVSRYETLSRHAFEVLRTTTQDQINLGIDESNKVAQLGDWLVGHAVHVIVGDEWVNLSPGEYECRIITARGSESGGSVLELEVEHAVT